MRTDTLQHIALFDKCKNFTRAREVQAAGLYPYFKPISRSEDTIVVIEGKERVMMGSNNYLGLTHHPEVLMAARAALERYGSGCTGSRFLNGTLDLHEQLETELAEFFGKESCLVFSTGYQANLGVISGLVGRSDVVFLDKLDHASIVDGAKMSHGETMRFNHGDLAGLERKLQRLPEGTGTLEFRYAQNLIVKLEGRYDHSTQPVFTGHGSTLSVLGAVLPEKLHDQTLVVLGVVAAF